MIDNRFLHLSMSCLGRLATAALLVFWVFFYEVVRDLLYQEFQDFRFDYHLSFRLYDERARYFSKYGQGIRSLSIDALAKLFLFLR